MNSTPNEQATISGRPVFNEDGTPMSQIELCTATVEVAYTKNRLVIIHDTDADGKAAAWVIAKWFGVEAANNILFIPQRAGENTIPSALTEYDAVYLVDRTYPWDTLKELSTKVASVTVLDHHKSALENYASQDDVNSDNSDALEFTPEFLHFEFNNIYVLIDTTHSACMLAHLYALEHSACESMPVTAPWFINYIEDRDLWKFELPDSKEINAAMWLLGVEQGNMDVWFKCLEEDNLSIAFDYLDNIKQIGKTVIKTQMKTIEKIAKGPTVSYGLIREALWYTPLVPPELHGKQHITVSLVCCPFDLISDLGNYMLNCTDPNFARSEVIICYNYMLDKELPYYTYSIRSKIPMDWFAKAKGGGGHPLACGFKSSLPPTHPELLKLTPPANPDLV